jgi:selenocysteine lyase/cysteine desulfurase
MATLDISAVRSAFPALSGPDSYLFADNAGGSQCLRAVADALSDYLLRTNVQLGADYSVSVTSTSRVNEGLEAARQLFNAESTNEVLFGSASTQVVENLSHSLEPDFQEGDEIVITTEHEGLFPVSLCGVRS